jgi:hypothetical protein
MSTSSHRAFTASRPRRRRWFALASALGCLALLPALAGGTSVVKVAKTTVVLGETPTTPDPSCPGKPCQAIGSVTGFQVSTDQESLPYTVPHAGKITAWTLTLSQPTGAERTFFNGFFGTPPEARLAILRRVPGTNPPRYNLRAQSSTKVLSPYLGKTVRFGSSLNVEKGDIVGISVPTWAPAFAQELPADNVWRASREPGKCINSTDLRQGEPQEKVGTRATYGCKYSTARLLYTATLTEK